MKWLESKYPREFLPKQREILNSDARYRFYSGAYGSGKTLLGCHIAITQCLQYPNNFWLMGCLTFPMLEDTVQRTFFEELDLYQKQIDDANGGIQLIEKWNETKKHLYLVTGSEIIFRSLEKASAAYAKFKSLNLGGFYIDEPVDVNQNVFRMLQGRLRLPNVPHIGIMGGNPSAKSNWVYKTFFEDHYTDPHYFVVNTTSLDNVYLPGDYIDDIEKWKTTDEAYYNRYVLGRWGALEGLVYNTFNRDAHVIKPFKIPAEWKRYRGIDFGYTNPFACVWIAIDHDENAYIYDEHYQSEMLIKEHALRIKEKSGDDKFLNTYADPSGKQERAELSSYGIYTAPANTDLIVGIQSVQKKLRIKENNKPSLYIFNTCKNVISEFEAYRWSISQGVANLKEAPLDKDNHALDAMRYVLFSMSKSDVKLLKVNVDEIF